MAAKPETGIVDNIVTWIKDQGGDAYKTLGSAAQRGGEPDVTGEIYVPEIEGWLHLKLEVKTDSGEPTERQTFRVNLYKLRGYVAGIVRSVEDVQKLIGEYMTEWRVKNAPTAVQAWDSAREDELLTIANGLQSQVDYLTGEDGQLRTEVSQLRLWIDRVYRPDADVPHLRSEMKKALDWL